MRKQLQVGCLTVLAIVLVGALLISITAKRTPTPELLPPLDFASARNIAAVECKSAIEHKAPHDFLWPPETPAVLEPDSAYALATDTSVTVVEFRGSDLKLSTHDGEWVQHPYECRWDTQERRADVSMTLAASVLARPPAPPAETVSTPQPTGPRWNTVTFSPDALTGRATQASGANSPSVHGEGLDWPYTDATAQLFFQCNWGGSETAWVRFSTEPNLTGGEYLSGYDTYTEEFLIRVAVGSNVSRRSVIQRSNSKDLNFRNDSWAIGQYLAGSEMALELPWFDSDGAIFRFPLTGSRDAIESARAECRR